MKEVIKIYKLDDIEKSEFLTADFLDCVSRKITDFTIYLYKYAGKERELIITDREKLTFISIPYEIE